MRSVLLVCLLFVAPALSAVQITLDYSRDGSSMFDSSTTNGQMARAAIEAAAGKLSLLLTDTLDPISKPETFEGQFSNHTWSYDLRFHDPATGLVTGLTDVPIGQDEVKVYVGALSLGGGTLASAAPGTSTIDLDYGSNLYTILETPIIEATTDALNDSLTTRGEESGFATWGGSLIFNSNQSWQRDHTMVVSSGQNDLYTTAMHELIHVLGFGVSSTWSALRQGSQFEGAESVAEFGGPVPLHSNDNGHWQAGITSPVINMVGSTAVVEQEAIMGPFLLPGSRKELTQLDVAGLEDLGWTVAALVPEPSTLVLLSMSPLVLASRRIR